MIWRQTRLPRNLVSNEFNTKFLERLASQTIDITLPAEAVRCFSDKKHQLPWLVLASGLLLVPGACRDRAVAGEASSPQPEARALTYDPADAAAATLPARAPTTPLLTAPALSRAPSTSPPLSLLAAGENEAAALHKRHAIPAWQSTLERYRMLARRGQSAALYGLLLSSPKGGWRLVDETVGDGALSIAVRLPESLAIETPLRVVLQGSWERGTTSTWRWRSTHVTSLGAPHSSPELAAVLTPLAREMPEQTVLASQAPLRGGFISFVVLRRSRHAGDGWLVADELGGKAVARLLLPGEKSSYGDLSRLAPDERWKLRPRKRYWLKIRRFKKPAASDLPIYRARTNPRF